MKLKGNSTITAVVICLVILMIMCAAFEYLHKNRKKFHYPDCRSVKQMSEHNKDYMTCTRDDAIARGYVSCKNCNP